MDEVAWRWIPAKGPLISCLVALHGMGQDGSVMARKLKPFSDRGVALLIPDGPYRFEIRGRDSIREGHSWYIYTGDQDRFLKSLETTEKDLLDLVEPILDEHRVKAPQTTLLGFSQGGYLAGFTACRNPHRFGNCVIASARLKHEFLTEELASDLLPAVLLLHDEKDPMTEPDPVRESSRILSEAGADVRVEWHSDGHQFGEGSKKALQDWLEMRGLLG